MVETQTGKDNVHPIKRQTPGQNATEQKKNFRFQLYSKMLGRDTDGGPPLKYEFKVLEDNRGVREPLIIEPGNVCKRYSPQGVINEIRRCALDYPKHFIEAPELKSNDITEIFNSWLAVCEPLGEEDIKNVAQKDEDHYTWHKLPFNYIDGKDAPTPTFDEFFSRIEPEGNRDAIKAWVGSLFFDDADRSQYVWLFGAGANGKGKFIQFLHRLFGSAALAGIVPKATEERFWRATLLGKRMVAFSDCSAFKFPASDTFKQVTGDHEHSIERKFMEPIMATLSTKFIFMSNKTPALSSTNADIRRAIYGEIGDLTTDVIPDKIYGDRLWSEAAGFVYDCITTYKKLCRDHSRIPTDNRRLDEIISANESDLREFIDEYLDEERSKKFLAEYEEGKKNASKHFISTKDLHRLIEDYAFKRRMQPMVLKNFIRRKFQYKKCSEWSGEKREKPWRYIGFVVKQGTGGRDY